MITMTMSTMMNKHKYLMTHGIKMNIEKAIHNISTFKDEFKSHMNDLVKVKIQNVMDKLINKEINNGNQKDI